MVVCHPEKDTLHFLKKSAFISSVLRLVDCTRQNHTDVSYFPAIVLYGPRNSHSMGQRSQVLGYTSNTTWPEIGAFIIRSIV